MPPPCDTSPEAEAVQIALLRQATTARRLQLALGLSDTTRHLARRAIDRAHPDRTEQEEDLLFVRIHYGDDLADKLAHYLETRDATRWASVLGVADLLDRARGEAGGQPF